MNKLSVVLAVYNEENNLKDCLESIKEIADEIVIVDGGSSDHTIEIAKSFNAKIIETDNPAIFHINKQKALEAAKNQWILQLDADERSSKKLNEEIVKVVNMENEDLENYEQNLPNKNLFLRHQKLLDERDGKIGTDSDEYSAFFIPRLNYFLGKYLRHGGVYPDGVIRLVKNGHAKFPAKDVHEQIEIRGKVGWLQNDLLHFDSPTFSRYIQRNNRYINLIVDELKRTKTSKGFGNWLSFFLIKPLSWFLMTQIRHKGILDGWQGIVFSFFSALRFPRAFFRYLTGGKG